MSKDTSESEIEERESLTIKIPLDPAHRRLDAALREDNIPVEKLVAQNIAPNAEQTLYTITQEIKYSDDE